MCVNSVTCAIRLNERNLIARKNIDTTLVFFSNAITFLYGRFKCY
jgi:hypothetical protein